MTSSVLMPTCHASYVAQNQRPSMEDTFVEGLSLVPHGCDGIMWAVFDGHGGREMSDALAKYMHVMISKIPKSFLKQRRVKDMELFLSIEFEKFDQECYRFFVKHNINHPGSTACVVLLYGTSDLFTINVGDSRAMVFQVPDYERTHATVDHKPATRGERARIEAAGGYVTAPTQPVDVHRVNGYLATSRSFGDAHPQMRLKHNQHGAFDPLHTPLTVRPDVEHYSLSGAGHMILLCTDGITDELTESDIGRILQRHVPDEEHMYEVDHLYNALQMITRQAMEHGQDNCTLMAFYVQSI